MKPDGMLVEPEQIVRARQDVATKGTGQVLTEFGQAEPALAAFIYESLAAVAGKLSLSGAPTELVQGTHEEVLAVILTSLRALRRSHYELWKDTMTGTRLAQLDEEFRAAPRRVRKKRRAGDSEPAPDESC
jgi:hypothetical protein